MTVIAAKVYDDKIVMSCDSQISRGYNKRNNVMPSKVIKGTDFLVGLCGDATLITFLHMFSKNHPIGDGEEAAVIDWIVEFLEFIKKKTGNWHATGNNQLLIAHKSGLYVIVDWAPIKVKDWYAIGSGFEYAEAALYLGRDTKTAVDVANELCYGCGGNIETFELTT